MIYTMNNLQLLTAIGILLQIADGVSTYIALQKGHIEANKIVSNMIKSLGLFWGLFVAKGIGIAALYLLYINNSDIGVICLIAIYTIVLVNNIKIIWVGK